ncbi:MAG: response regulator [Bacteriovoracaceae bacterium]|nr:response regulator [Bacteriovoracaceae bacterium]
MVILVVDDLRDMRELVIASLQELMPNAVFIEAQSGTEASEKIEKFEDRLSFIVCDFHMDNGNGDVVFNKWKTTCFHIPFILLTSEVAEARGVLLRKNPNLWERLAFLHKSGDFEELKNTFERLLRKGFLKLSKSLIEEERSLNIPLYLSLSDKKIIRYCHQGDTIPKGKLEKLNEKGLDSFLVPVKEALSSGFVWPLKPVHVETRDNPQSIEESFKKFKDLHHDVLINDFVDPEKFNKATTLIDYDLKRLSETKLFSWVLEKGFTEKNYVLNHSLLLSTFCIMGLLEMDLNTPHNRKSVIESCFFHDLFKSDKEAIEQDLYPKEFDRKKQQVYLLQLLDLAKEMGLSQDSDKILEALCMGLHGHYNPTVNHKLASIALSLHKVSNELYSNAFTKELSNEALENISNQYFQNKKFLVSLFK